MQMNHPDVRCAEALGELVNLAKVYSVFQLVFLLLNLHVKAKCTINPHDT